MEPLLTRKEMDMKKPVIIAAIIVLSLMLSFLVYRSLDNDEIDFNDAAVITLDELNQVTPQAMHKQDMETIEALEERTGE